MRVLVPVAMAAALLTARQTTASAQVQAVDFEQFSGPSVFDSAKPPLTVGVATFSGGEVLSATTFLPADPTNVYGTSFFCSGCASTITIDFSVPVSNVSMFVANGQTFTVTYTARDDQGGVQTIALAANFQSGAGTLTLPSSGVMQVTVSGDTFVWDFFVDNVTFETCSGDDPCVLTREDAVLGCVIDDGRHFSPDFWNDSGDIQLKNNCYAYATNKDPGTFPQPGRAEGLTPAITCPDMTTASVADGLSTADCNASCPSSSRKIALVVDPNVDFHWYRQDAGGTWSHKPGQTPAVNVDASGRPITDPRTANRDYTSTGGPNYGFCGCFCTSPDCDEDIL
jgi:hypothetical protein